MTDKQIWMATANNSQLYNSFVPLCVCAEMSNQVNLHIFWQIVVHQMRDNEIWMSNHIKLWFKYTFKNKMVQFLNKRASKIVIRYKLSGRIYVLRHCQGSKLGSSHPSLPSLIVLRIKRNVTWRARFGYNGQKPTHFKYLCLENLISWPKKGSSNYWKGKKFFTFLIERRKVKVWTNPLNIYVRRKSIRGLKSSSLIPGQKKDMSKEQVQD